MPTAVFTIRITQFRDFIAGEGESTYEILPPAFAEKKSKMENGQEKVFWEIGPVTLHVGHYQKKYTYATKPPIPTTVRLEQPHAVLAFEVTDKDGKAGPYYPVGIAFTRADETTPIGAPSTTGAQKIPITVKDTKQYSPFSKLSLNDPFRQIEVDVERIEKLYSKTKGSEKASHRTYRVIMFIQELATGKIGMLDPEIEPPT